MFLGSKSMGRIAAMVSEPDLARLRISSAGHYGYPMPTKILKVLFSPSVTTFADACLAFKPDHQDSPACTADLLTK